MKDLLQCQIKKSCGLALPEGLKELMSDISREVLRAQPQDICNFIADYLSAMLVTRENLVVASRLCSDICASSCHRELEDELRFIGFDDDDAKRVHDVIVKYFDNGGASEVNLLLKIVRDTNINESQLEDVKKAVQKAFKRHLVNNTVLYESSSESELDVVERAAKHTLKLYRKTNVSDNEFAEISDKLLSSYKAYGVERQEDENAAATGMNIRFCDTCHTDSSHSLERPKLQNTCKPHLLSVSSSSLAGSFLNLPKYIPYSVHNSQTLENVDESEKEMAHGSFSYKDESKRKPRFSSNDSKRICFQDAPPKVIQDFDDDKPSEDDGDESDVTKSSNKIPKCEDDSTITEVKYIEHYKHDSYDEDFDEQIGNISYD